MDIPPDAALSFNIADVLISNDNQLEQYALDMLEAIRNAKVKPKKRYITPVTDV